MVRIFKNPKAATFSDLLLRRSNHSGSCETFAYLIISVLLQILSASDKSQRILQHFDCPTFLAKHFQGRCRFFCLAITAREISLIYPCLLPTGLRLDLVFHNQSVALCLRGSRGTAWCELSWIARQENKDANGGHGRVSCTCDRDEPEWHFQPRHFHIFKWEGTKWIFSYSEQCIFGSSE